MAGEIIKSTHWTDWLKTPAGAYVLDWEQRWADEVTADCFGYHALQLGLSQLQALRHNRILHRWVALGENEPGQADLHSAPCALPFANDSLDLVVLPHTLELSPDPHATLREVARVLVPEGRLLVLGLNPNSLWGWRYSRAQWLSRWWSTDSFLPDHVELIGTGRLRDWLQLLNFEPEPIQFGAYVPSVQSPVWLQRWRWMDRAGPRWWPFLGAIYAQAAVKRVQGMRLIEPAWRERKRSARALVVTGSGSVSSQPRTQHTP